MDSINSIGKDALQRRPSPSKPKQALPLSEPIPLDEVSLARPNLAEVTSSVVSKTVSKATPPRKAPAEPAAQNSPQTLFLDSVAPEASVGLTVESELSKITAKAPGKVLSPLSAPPLKAGKKAGIIRRLGHGFVNFLTSDPLQAFQKDLQRINALEKSLSHLKTPEQFQAKTQEFKARLQQGESLIDMRVEAYAVARQAAWQALGLKPYDCQVLGALAMDDGHIAEMRTGEGKTLTAVMPLYLNALAGKGAHLVTVNDTLASRDAAEMTPAFNLLGMSVGTVLEDMPVDKKRQAYAADITYTTDRSLGFDYLRDQTAKNPNSRVQREPFFALIDEVDEVLIDEARSPLIVSQQGESLQSEYLEFNEVVASLKAGSDYYLDRKQHSVWLSDSGFARVENILGERELRTELESCKDGKREKEITSELKHRASLHEAISQEQVAFEELREVKKSKPGLLARLRGQQWDDTALETAELSYGEAQNRRQGLTDTLTSVGLFSDEKSHRVRFLYASLKAHALFEAGKDYTVSAGKVEIIDENKGRTSDGRRYNDGVHQAIEAKEGVKVGDEQRAIASITYPNLFSRYPRLSGMSGTAKTSEAEFLKLYELDVLQVPTHEPIIRIDEKDLVFRTLEEKYEALARDASADFFEGKPVLIGTLSVEHNEYVAKLLLQRGIPRDSLQVLNAETVRGDKAGENQMIGQAGRSGVITVATNLAGRGANIKPDLINFRKLVEHSILAAQEKKPVSVTVAKRAEAEWMQSWLGDAPSVVVANDKAEVPLPGQIQIRYTKGVDPSGVAPQWLPDTVQLKGEDYPTGGLTVYGTERSSSRRIDDQLIGRSGRQGAPGRSRFYLSLEDDLLRIFAGSKLDSVLSHFIKPAEGVSNTVIDQVVSQAQSSVEQDHFSARESSNKQDEVLNVQRDAYFHLRNDLLEGGAALKARLNSMVSNSILETIFRDLRERSNYNYGELTEAVRKASMELKIPISLPFLDPKNGHPPETKMSADDFEFELRDMVDRSTDKLLRALQKTTGRGEEAVRPLVLDVVDEAWSEHLEMMESLRLGIQWQSLAQKDPEVEFKFQAFELFTESVNHMNRQVSTGLYKDLLTFSEVVSTI